ncbi:MAG TPA: carboxypeptidase regulatory-like domain-containing protein, partial [Chitinophagaceae bacterium]|nr:carboxypeptidase regulatory-like domain-containing protein [Chitinophagaceae bacterium]
MKKNLLSPAVAGCVALLLLLTSTGYAQPKSFKISGVIKDSAQKPLTFVTVSLFKQQQLQQPLRSSYTNDAGKFQFNAVDTGAYTVIVSHTGFAEKQEKITVTDKDIAMTDMSLVRAAASLQGVTVTSRKPLIEQTDDKIIFNVENDPATKTETAIDILRKTPFVSVDGDDNVQVNGQTNFKV